MRSLPSAAFRNAVPHAGDSDEDLDATVSFSGSDDDLPDPPGLQQLARSLLAWGPALVPHYAGLDYVSAELAPFADFLTKLGNDVKGQPALRGEIAGWLQALPGDDATRRRAFRMVAAAGSASTALESYQAIRRAGD